MRLDALVLVGQLDESGAQALPGMDVQADTRSCKLALHKPVGHLRSSYSCTRPCTYKPHKPVRTRPCGALDCAAFTCRRRPARTERQQTLRRTASNNLARRTAWTSGTLHTDVATVAVLHRQKCCPLDHAVRSCSAGDRVGPTEFRRRTKTPWKDGEWARYRHAASPSAAILDAGHCVA